MRTAENQPASAPVKDFDRRKFAERKGLVKVRMRQREGFARGYDSNRRFFSTIEPPAASRRQPGTRIGPRCNSQRLFQSRQRRERFDRDPELNGKGRKLRGRRKIDPLVGGYLSVFSRRLRVHVTHVAHGTLICSSILSARPERLACLSMG